MEHIKQLPPLSTRRRLVNALTTRIVGLGGVAVIGAIILIFVYLLWVVAPMLRGASIEPQAQFSLPPGSPLLTDINETGEVGLRVDQSGKVLLFDTQQGDVIDNRQHTSPLAQAIPVIAAEPTYALLTNKGYLRILSARFRVNFIDEVRQLTAQVERTFPGSNVQLGKTQAIDVALQDDTLLVASLHDKRFTLRRYADAEEGFELEDPTRVELDLERRYDWIHFGPRQRTVYLVAASGDLEVLQLKRRGAPERRFIGRLAPDEQTMTSYIPLLGRTSLLVATDAPKLTQRFLVRTESGYELKSVREFDLDTQVTRLIPEPRRKGFIAQDANNRLHLGYATTGALMASHDLNTHWAPNTAQADATAMAISPRSDALSVLAASGQSQFLELDNKHPEVSWRTLWGKVWYEGYAEPIYSWQSSAAANDFEPKFSLTPLLFGTIKAAAYALLFAVPIAIMGAIYTAYFMAAPMRALVKPGIEIMAALPTVILGFLAGLWLAPIIEAQLSSVLSVFVVVPIGLLLFSWLWRFVPSRAQKFSNGWYGLIVIAPMGLLFWLSFELGPVLEASFFGGDSKAWFQEYLGLSFDQRNSLVVGIAMGLAVIPSIFSIAEDAIYGVPRSLVNGSLALGATPWQTLIRVVILTASPGIFSAIMIGMGRAVGETMIVLMATGNTPVMDWNIFQGMRTFAANIAVELPESEVASTHYRILFLAALVLFFITFAFNTIAELVRQRLRSRYGNL